jgi:hypothetical protein
MILTFALHGIHLAELKKKEHTKFCEIWTHRSAGGRFRRLPKTTK